MSVTRVTFIKVKYCNVYLWKGVFKEGCIWGGVYLGMCVLVEGVKTSYTIGNDRKEMNKIEC